LSHSSQPYVSPLAEYREIKRLHLLSIIKYTILTGTSFVGQVDLGADSARRSR
jgi:hypothetical protein